MIEFSSAALTGDHEQQRADNYIPLYSQNFIHVKISSKKQSSSQHGGDTNFDPNLILVVAYKTTGKIPYRFDWSLKSDSVLDVDKKYLACPKPIPQFIQLIEQGVKNYIKNSQTWIENTNNKYLSHKQELEAINIPDVTKLNTSRLKYVIKDERLGSNVLILKINRFGHAMDPERGMLVYHGMIHNRIITKFMFTEESSSWYNGTSGKKKIDEYIKKHGLKSTVDFITCFGYGTGTYEDLSKLLPNIKNKELDITEYVAKNFFKFAKPLKIIFGFSNMVIINNKSDETKAFLKFKKIDFKNNNLTNKITPIKEDIEYTEDKLTYVIVHNVLKTNNYKIINVSYPAAQGDRPMLVQAGTGRKQKREYIDIIAKHYNILSLCENKIKINELGKDIDKLKKYKKIELMPIIKNFISKYTNDDSRPCIRIGVGYIDDNTSKCITTPSTELDYYISVNKKMWKIWHNEVISIFKQTKGEVKLPKIYSY